MNFLKQAPNLYNQLISGWEGGGERNAKISMNI